MKRTAYAVLLTLGIGTASMIHPASAQTVDPWTAIKQLQTDIRAGRHAVVAQNLPLNDAESKAFWSVYDQYRKEADALGDRTAAMVAGYAANFESMNDAKADGFFKEWMAIERDRTAIRDKYVPKIRAVLPAQKAARLFQIDNKLDSLINLELAAGIPLTPLPQK
jgi:hypothetical protein